MALRSVVATLALPMHLDPRNARAGGGASDGATPGGNPWLLIGAIVGAKVGTILAILFFSMSHETGGFVLLTHWHWIPMLGALVAAPAAYAIRVRRVRARRDALRRAEWMIVELDVPASTLASPPAGLVDRRRAAQ